MPESRSRAKIRDTPAVSGSSKYRMGKHELMFNDKITKVQNPRRNKCIAVVEKNCQVAYRTASGRVRIIIAANILRMRTAYR